MADPGRRQSTSRPRRSRTHGSSSHCSRLLLQAQIVLADNCRNLTHLIALGLPLLVLQVQELSHRRIGEHSMTAAAPDLAEAEGFDETDHVAEVDVGHLAAAN